MNKNKLQNNNLLIDTLIKQSTIISQINYIINLNNSTNTNYVISTDSFNSISKDIENIIILLNTEIKNLTDNINSNLQQQDIDIKQEEEILKDGK